MSEGRRICISAAGANAGGAVTYLINLLSEFSRTETGDRYLVIAPQETLDVLSDSLQSPFIEAFTYPHPPVRQHILPCHLVGRRAAKEATLGLGGTLVLLLHHIPCHLGVL